MNLTIPYLNMSATITVGAVTFTNVNSFYIEEDITGPGNTARVTVPLNYEKYNNKPVKSYLKVGDPVTIAGGYNGSENLEFRGYLKHIGAGIPLVLDIDDQFYPLKQTSWIKSYGNVSLRTLLTDVITGYQIDCPDMTIGPRRLNKASSYALLKELQTDYGLFSRINDNTLVVGFAWDWDVTKTQKWLYDKQKNVRMSDLVWKDTSDFDVRVNVYITAPDGHKQQISYSNGAIQVAGIANSKSTPSSGKESVVALYYGNISVTDAQKIAQARYTKYVYNGFTGTITGFGVPYVHAGDSLQIVDAYNTGQNGTYLVKGVRISYGPNGYERICELGYLLS